ncbi:MAG: hypothetical protein ACI3X9_07140 [Bacteroidaceae bacterium]
MASDAMPASTRMLPATRPMLATWVHWAGVLNFIIALQLGQGRQVHVCHKGPEGAESSKQDNEEGAIGE